MVQVYLDKETQEIRNKLERDEFSKIVQNALKEHSGANIDLPSAKAKILFLSDEIKQKQAMKLYWEGKVKELEKGEAEKQERERRAMERQGQKEKEREEVEKNKLFNTNLKALKSMFEVSEKEATASVKEYLNAKAEGKVKGGFADYFRKKGLKKKQGRK